MSEIPTIVVINCIEQEFSSVCMSIKIMAILMQKWPVNRNKEVFINDVKMLMCDWRQLKSHSPIPFHGKEEEE